MHTARTARLEKRFPPPFANKDRPFVSTFVSFRYFSRISIRNSVSPPLSLSRFSFSPLPFRRPGIVQVYLVFTRYSLPTFKVEFIPRPLVAARLRTRFYKGLNYVYPLFNLLSLFPPVFPYVIKKRCYYRYPNPAEIARFNEDYLFGLVTRSSPPRYDGDIFWGPESTIPPFLRFLSLRDQASFGGPYLIANTGFVREFADNDHRDRGRKLEGERERAGVERTGSDLSARANYRFRFLGRYYRDATRL